MRCCADMYAYALQWRSSPGNVVLDHAVNGMLCRYMCMLQIQPRKRCARSCNRQWDLVQMYMHNVAQIQPRKRCAVDHAQMFTAPTRQHVKITVDPTEHALLSSLKDLGHTEVGVNR